MMFRPLYRALIMSLLSAICSPGIAATGELKVEPQSRFDSAMMASSNLGDVIVGTRYLLAAGQMSGGGVHVYGLFIVMDNSTGRFQWMLREPPPNLPEGLIRKAFEAGTAAAHTSSRAVVIFTITPGRLDVTDSINEARDMIDAEGKAVQAAAQAPGSELGGMSPRWRSISIAEIPNGFWAAPAHANSGPLRILAISQHDGGWQIVIEGQWKELIMLDDNFQLIKMQRLEP